MYVTKLVDSIIAGITGGASSRMFEILKPYTVDRYVYPSIIAAFVFFFLSVLFGMVMRLNKKKFEGSWMQVVEKGGKLYLSRFSIVYNYLSAKHILAGTACDETGELHSSWTSRWMEFDTEHEKITYLYTGTIHKENEVPGYAVLYFQPSASKPFLVRRCIGFSRPQMCQLTYGTGFFVDMGVQPVRCDYKFYRYDEALVRELVDREDLPTPETIATFIAKYVDKYPDRVLKPSKVKVSARDKMVVKNEMPSMFLPQHIDSPLLKAYFEVNFLKQLYRQGWLRGKVPPLHCETVAEHSFGVAFMAMLVQDDSLKSDSDRLKAITMALIHDLGEVYGGDHVPGQLPEQEKYHRELYSVTEIFSKLSSGNAYVDLWREFEASNSTIAKLVNDLDDVERRLQACIYEKQGLAALPDFFKERSSSSNDQIQQILDAITQLRTDA